MELKGKNIERAARIDDVLEAYCMATGDSLDGGQEEAVVDLLADLMHWAARENLDWLRCSERAELHYDYESRNPEER